MSIKYQVTIEKFAERHYLKNFHKRYKKSFEAPWVAFILMLQKFELMTERDGTDPITDKTKDVVIYKTEFKVPPEKSAKTSGNRCIVALYRGKNELKILLVYCKNNIKGGNETVWWKGVVKKNYPIYRKLFMNSAL